MSALEDAAPQPRRSAGYDRPLRAQRRQFHLVHEVVSDSDGNLYTGEVETGKHV